MFARGRVATRPLRAGFTLTELMISLALVLLLVLAITQIFGITTAAIGKGHATGEVTRGLDATRTALQIDLTGTDRLAYDTYGDTGGIIPLSRQPAIIISGSLVETFMDLQDHEQDADGDVSTLDSDNDGIDDYQLSPYELGQRQFRTDSISFFTEGEFESQTDTSHPDFDNSFSGNVSSNEAWVWYGHGRVYDGEGPLNSGSYPNGHPKEGQRIYPMPGEYGPEDNPHNFFANQFVLLRTQMVLKAQVDHDGNPETAITAVDDDGVPIAFLRPMWDPSEPEGNLYPNAGGPPNVMPFSAPTYARYFDESVSATATPIYYRNHPMLTDGTTDYANYDSRLDVAGVDTETYRERLEVAQAVDETGVASGEPNGPLSFDSRTFMAEPPTWYNRSFSRLTRTQANVGRFWINPLVLKPLDAGELSQATSLLLGGASQFIVEYAGDFITQNEIGDTTANVPDGIIDATIDESGVRHIRWYGMPRDVDGDGAIPGQGASATVDTPLGTSNVLLTSIDVRPLADYVIPANNMNVNTGFPFEKRLPGAYAGTPEAATGRESITDYVTDLDPDSDEFGYLVAWGPGDFDGTLYPNTTHDSIFISAENPTGALRPSLLRVIVQGIDARGRLDNAISSEFVFAVPTE